MPYLSNLHKKLETGKFVKTAELGPPKSANPDDVKRKAQYLRAFDAVNVTDNQLGVCRMSAIAASKLLLDEGLEPTPQITLRDRNSLGLQSDLLGTYALGIRNLLCLTGDHPRFGSHPNAKPVYEMTIIEFLKKVNNLQQGVFFNDEAMKDSSSPPCFFVGAACNPFTGGKALEAKHSRPLGLSSFRAGGDMGPNIDRMSKKIAAGARFFQTQPVFDCDAFREWLDAMNGEGLTQKCSILAGVMPIKSAKGMHYLAEKVPGARVPAEVLTRMDSSADQEKEGKLICAEIIKKLRHMKGISGIHLMSIGWESSFPEVIKMAELK